MFIEGQRRQTFLFNYLGDGQERTHHQDTLLQDNHPIEKSLHLHVGPVTDELQRQRTTGQIYPKSQSHRKTAQTEKKRIGRVDFGLYSGQDHSRGVNPQCYWRPNVSDGWNKLPYWRIHVTFQHHSCWEDLWEVSSFKHTQETHTTQSDWTWDTEINTQRTRTLASLADLKGTRTKSRPNHTLKRLVFQQTCPHHDHQVHERSHLLLLSRPRLTWVLPLRSRCPLLHPLHLTHQEICWCLSA